jgi:xanthine dehydrogenase large subunit
VARKAAALVEVEYAPRPAVLTIQDAIAAKTFLAEPHIIRRGDVDGAL